MTVFLEKPIRQKHICRNEHGWNCALRVGLGVGIGGRARNLNVNLFVEIVFMFGNLDMAKIREINGDVILVSDIHGEWNLLFDKINRLKLTDCVMFQIGDLGCGFDGGREKDFVRYNEWFKNKNIQFFAIHGNHDLPTMFDGSVNLSHFKLIPDYTVMKVNGEVWQFVGGATSVDRKWRTEGKSWWRDEVFVLKENKAVKCDVLITHTAPSWIGPGVKGKDVQAYFDKDLHLKDELLAERTLVDRLFDICKPTKAFFGHFHLSAKVIHCGKDYNCRGRILDIAEFLEYKSTNYLDSAGKFM